MKVIDVLSRATSTLQSYEIIPPLRGGSIEQMFRLVDQLMPFSPPFIDITSRAAESYYGEMSDGSLRSRVRRKRPGTLGICAAIKNRYNVETVPHLLCRGFSKEETEDALIELNYLGIQNVLAITGDNTRSPIVESENRTANRFSVDLVRQIAEINSGHFLETLEEAQPTDFCVGVGGYPEKHELSPDVEADIRYLKNKVDCGADYIVTQMCFDNASFFAFVDRARDAGIRVPIVPGLKILTRKSHLRILPEVFRVAIPELLRNQVEEAPQEEVREIGIRWALEQCQELVSHGVPCLHFYVMQDAAAVTQIVSQLR